METEDGRLKSLCSVVQWPWKKGEPFLGKTLFSGAATTKRGKTGAPEQLSLGSLSLNHQTESRFEDARGAPVINLLDGTCHVLGHGRKLSLARGMEKVANEAPQR